LPWQRRSEEAEPALLGPLATQLKICLRQLRNAGSAMVGVLATKRNEFGRRKIDAQEKREQDELWPLLE
jgi:hypothetical protein